MATELSKNEQDRIWDEWFRRATPEELRRLDVLAHGPRDDSVPFDLDAAKARLAQRRKAEEKP